MSGERSLRVSLDVSAVPLDPRGAGRYTVELARALGRRDDVELTLEARSGDAGRWAGWLPAATVLAAAPGPRPLRLAWEQVSLPSVLRRQPLDVHHGPHYTMPERSRLPKVVTVHDMTFFDHPEWHERTKVPVFRRAIRRAAERADVIVCVSEPTADRLRTLLAPRATVVVAVHGIDHEHFVPEGADGVSEADDLERLGRIGIRPPYVGYLGTVEPRKGLDLLVTAFDRIAASHPQHRLVVAGGRGWGAEPVEAAISAMGHAGRVDRPGYLPDDVVPAFLRRASVVVYPSRDEGFGLPVIEALACGVSVITTAGSVMDHLAGGAALGFPAGDAPALADLLDSVLSGAGPDTKRQREAGLGVAARYTWAASAAQHVDAYRSAALA